MFIINAPWIFTAAWAVIKPWIHPITAAKITVLGHNKAKNLEAIAAANIDPAQLSEHLGGTRTTPLQMDGEDLEFAW
jgi:hypothetical protein